MPPTADSGMLLLFTLGLRATATSVGLAYRHRPATTFNVSAGSHLRALTSRAAGGSVGRMSSAHCCTMNDRDVTKFPNSACLAPLHAGKVIADATATAARALTFIPRTIRPLALPDHDPLGFLPALVPVLHTCLLHLVKRHRE